MGDERACLTCRYFRQQDGYDGGNCLRYPPVPMAQYSFDGSGAVHFDNLRPYVSSADWCGEHLTPAEHQERTDND
jgi:hypothetical protein